MSTSFCVVLITVPSPGEAGRISEFLIKEKLAACVNTIPKIGSCYWWKGKIEKASESLLIVKTKKSLIAKLIRKVKSVHSYSVPEVIALPIVKGSSDYLNWLSGSLSRKG